MPSSLNLVKWGKAHLAAVSSSKNNLLSEDSEAYVILVFRESQHRIMVYFGLEIDYLRG